MPSVSGERRRDDHAVSRTLQDRRTDETVRTRWVELARVERPSFRISAVHVCCDDAEDMRITRRVESGFCIGEAGRAFGGRSAKHWRWGRNALQAGLRRKRSGVDFRTRAVGEGRVRQGASGGCLQRACLALEVDTSFDSRRVTRALEDIVPSAGILGRAD